MRSLWKTTGMLVLGVVAFSLTLPTRAADLDKLAPVDAEAIMVINFKNFLDSPLFKKYGEEAMKSALKDEKAQKLLEATGLDPTKDLNTFTVTFTGGKADPKMAAILKGTFNVAKIQATIEKEANKAGEKLKIAKEGGLTYYSMANPQNGQEVTATFIGNDAMVMSNNKDYLKAIIDGKKGEATEGSKVLAKTVGKLGGKDTMFMAVAMTQELKDGIGNIPNSPLKDIAPKLSALTGSVNLTQAIDLTVSIHTTDEMTAKQLNQLVSGLKPLAKLLAQGDGAAQFKPVIDALLDNLKLTAEGTAFNARLQLTEELLKKLQPGGGN